MRRRQSATAGGGFLCRVAIPVLHVCRSLPGTDDTGKRACEVSAVEERSSVLEQILEGNNDFDGGDDR